jgi:energy-coupling factor transporter ATP-binding protein EcfA2
MKNVKLNSEQQAALEKIKQGGNCIIPGNAGTGKSTLLRHLHEAIPEAVFVAPTGAAARLIGGVTINSLFRIPHQPYITDWSMGVISNKGVRKTIKAIKVLVVDESSLVRSDIFAAIDYRLRQYAPDGCAKYRYNKLVKGAVCGIPRVLDAGQCNDCYSLAVIALKLKEIFGTADINELPLSFDIAWYEQKAVAVLLALLHLGFKNIRLGPGLPAFYRRISRKLW